MKQKIVAQCEDVQAPVVLLVERQWLVSLGLHEALRHKGYFIAFVHGWTSGDQELFMALYKACRFPDWFGFNWDALNDSLGDFSWQPAGGYILIFEHPPSLSPERQRTFLEILEAKQQEWARYGVPFKVLMPE